MEEFGSYEEDRTYFAHYHRENSSGPERGDSSPPIKYTEERRQGVAEQPGVIPHEGPLHPRYASVAARLRTFDQWPPALKQKPQVMAEAGFIYLGLSDQVKCFYCDGGLKEWGEEDDPWVEHAGWYYTCGFMRLVRGDQYIERCRQLVNMTLENRRSAGRTEQDLVGNINIDERKINEKESNSNVYIPDVDISDVDISDVDVSELVAENSRLREQKTCKVCMDAEVGVVFLPCGHLVVCGNCATSLKSCAVCRTTITGTIRTFFS